VADLKVADVLEAIRRDKKVVDGRLHFVTITEIGRSQIVDDVTEAELRGALTRIGLSG
jgi:3-dehydroquinate synthetase